MAYLRKTKDIHISPRLNEVLQKISHKSDIAKLLLKTKISKDDLVDDPIDYISISKEDPTKISYAYSDKLAKVEPEEYWSFKGRVQAKPAAAIKKILKNTTEKELDLFTSLFKSSTAEKDFSFEIVYGEDIKKYYFHKSYKNQNSGSLGMSCMKHDVCMDFFDVYIKNSDACKLLVMLDNDGLLLGRALLWQAVDVEKGTTKKVMDRIYSINDEKNIHLFKEWADENGYIARKDQKWGNSMYFEVMGKSIKFKLGVRINKEAFANYPYVDTFKFWDEKNAILTNFLPTDNGYVRTLVGSNGSVLNYDYLELDTINDIYDHSSKMATLEYEINGVIGHRTSADILYYSRIMDKFMIQEHGYYDEEVNDYLFIDVYAHLNDKKAIADKKASSKKSNKSEDIELSTLSFLDYVRTTTNIITDMTFSPVEAPNGVEEPIAEEPADEMHVIPVRPRGLGRHIRLNRLDRETTTIATDPWTDWGIDFEPIQII